MKVSVIIPAHNAAVTLADTLGSLLAQTFSDWEAIVIDDGSTDRTRSIAENFAAGDARIRVASQPQGGESGARNTGIGLARFDWLLFLDADDWLLPTHLEELTAKLAQHSDLDGAISGWTRVAPDGRFGDEKHCLQPADVFELSTRVCPFAIHACVIRRTCVESAGGFDSTLHTCADWDMWQRIARAGARFQATAEVTARYRMRPDSAGIGGARVLRDALRVIRRGHSADPRVANPVPRYASGVRPELLAKAQFHFSCWGAGLTIGNGDDACDLLDLLGEGREPDLDPNEITWMIFESVLLPECRVPSDWLEIWPIHEHRIKRFLEALQARSLAPGIAARTLNLLERLVIQRAPVPRPITAGRSHGVSVEITAPLTDISPPSGAERLLCEVRIEGESLGSIELPVCNGSVPAYLLADAIAATFAWPILGRYFERTVYRHLEVRREGNDVSAWREEECVGRWSPNEQKSFWQEAHNRIGWRIFLQEVWYGRETAPRRTASDGCCSIDIADPIPDIYAAGSRLDILATVGGSTLGLVTADVQRGVLPADHVRGKLLDASGFESCRIAVREALLGRPLLAPPASLRERLKEAAREAAAPGSSERLAPCLVLAARLFQPIGTSASRRAVLPAAAAPDLVASALTAGEKLVTPSRSGDQPHPVIYAPDMVAYCPEPAPSIASSVVPRLLEQARRYKQGRLVAGRGGQEAGNAVNTARLPILMYHRIAEQSDETLARYGVTPRAFEEQLRHLRQAGYRSVSLEEWRRAMKDEQPLSGRAVILTFDDGYLDFLTCAWPLLKRYGFSATVFLVAEQIGTTNRWDSERAKEARLLGWSDIRHLRSLGVEFGSHSASHRPLSALSPLEIVREGARSRAILERELREPVSAFAYPHGAQDQIVQHLIGACGYVFGLSCEFRLSSFFDSLLGLPRIEVKGSDTLEGFVGNIEGQKADHVSLCSFRQTMV
ncbi:MAG: glycosyltransferase [Acidobacteria bacterium]|nr:MAG: glycosyltransferase [Acidobacteriota bacterium]